MIIITGGLGFIGSNILSKLNRKNKKDILLVDSPNKEKLKNIKGLNYDDLIEKQNFLKKLYQNKYKNIDYILHQGACTDTQETNLEYLINNNYEYSKKFYNIVIIIILILYMPPLPQFTEMKKNYERKKLLTRKKLKITTHYQS